MVKHLLRLPDGTEIFSGANEWNAVQSFTLTECVNSETELYVGSVCAAMLEMSLITPEGELSINAGDEVTLFQVDDGVDRVQLGRFILEKPTRSGPNKMKLTAYDFVSKLDKDLTAWLLSLSEWPYRLDTFAGMVCNACGVELEEMDIPNRDYLVQKFLGDGITGRQLMEWAAQVAGRFCRATHDGKIEFAWYKQNPDPIGPTGDRFYFQGSLSYEDYETEKIDRVRIQLTSDDVGVSYPDNEGEASTYPVTGNYLLTTDDAETLVPVAQHIYEVLKNFTYTPFKCSVSSSLGIRAGDIVQVTDKNGHTFTSIVMNRIHTTGKDELECTGSATRDSSDALCNTTMKTVVGKIFEVKKSIDGLEATVSRTETDLQGQIDRNSASIGVLSDNINATVEQYTEDMDGIQQQVSQLQQAANDVSIIVQTIESDGVDKVTTKEKRFTFNDSGLHIGDKGLEIVNTIDETGMYVTHSGSVMLQANEDGVIATDLTARNYLIVGTHARFEDYGDGRSACFHL